MIFPFSFIVLLLYRLFYLELSYSFLIIPLTFVLIVDIYIKLIENRNQLEGYYNEAELFKKLLAEKKKNFSLAE
jgi:hypothetical protein